MSDTKNTDHYFCKKCNYTCFQKKHWEQHIKTKKHIKIKEKYYCSICKYNAKNNQLYQQHLQTKKHKNNETNVFDYKYNYIKEKENIKDTMNGNNVKINDNYKELKHDNKTREYNDDNTNNTFSAECLNNDILQNIIHKQNEIIKQMMETQTETNKHLLEMSKEPKVINNVYNSANTIHNTTFNLNNFLNVDCNDAPNFKDFIFSLQIGRHDLEFLQENGYIKSYENVIVKQLENMEQTKRPLHCLDQKRKKFILKDKDTWTKENIEKTLRLSIDHFSNLLIYEYNKWKDDHPDWKENTDDEIFDIGLYLSNEILSPYNEKKNSKIEAKVIQNMLNFTIEKNKHTS